MGESLTIGQVAEKAGVAASAIRYYERIGLLPAPHRVNGRRRYSADVLDALVLIRLGQRAGFTLGELRTFRRDEDDQLPRGERDHLLRRRLAEIRASIRQMRKAERLLAEALSCGCLDLTACPRIEKAAR